MAAETLLGALEAAGRRAHAVVDATREPPLSVSLGALRCAARVLARRCSRVLDCHDAPPDVAQEAVVGVLMGEGLELLLAQLAALYAGAAFVLLEPCLPTARLEYMAADAAVALVLARAVDPAENAERADAGAVRSRDAPAAGLALGVTSLDVDARELLRAAEAEMAAGPVRAEASSGSLLAYVCYTSGTSGRPKGVLVESRSLLWYARANAATHGVDEGSRVLLASAASFDPAIGEAWTALLAGATLWLPARARVVGDLPGEIRASGATHVCTTPALWASVPAGLARPQQQREGGPLASLACVALGGEAPPPSLVSTWAAAVPLYNVYGVTECVGYQASGRLVARSQQQQQQQLERECALLGDPMDGIAFALVDAAGAELPISPGLEGELVISGASVARGYCRLPELTAAAFTGGTAGVRRYRTGDIGRYEAGGRIRLLGRADSQVKLSGVRVELGEVEAALGDPHLLRNVAAVVVDGALALATEPHDAALATCPPLAAAAAALVAVRARRWLPRAARPRRIALLASLPLSASGKLARAEIAAEIGAAADGATPASGGQRPRGALEVAVAASWCAVLGVTRVGRRSDFLALGGDSIRALQVSRALEASLFRADGGAVSSAPPARWIRGTKEEVARTLARLSVEEARADYGLVGGIFSPAALLATPTLYRYAGQLRAAGLRVADTDADANVEGEESDAEADGADGAGAGCGCEDVTWRLRELAGEIAGEIKAEDGGGGGAQQEALQLALAVAARHGHAALARRALDLGADPAPRPAAKRRGAVATISGGLPALHEACTAGHARIAAMLLDAKASVTLLSAGGVPPLHAAAAAGAVEVIELLVARGAPLKMPDDRRQSALVAASRAGRVGAIEALLRAGVGLEWHDRWHRTALHWAVVNGREDAAAALVGAGAAVNGVPMPVSKHIRHTTLPQETPLHSAARLASPVSAVALVSLLIGARADPDRTDQFGQRPLHVAAGRAPGGGGSEPCHGAEEQLLRLLCPLAATARAPDGAGITPIERARRTGSARAERVLAELVDRMVDRMG